jgi:hypothetical protein
MGIAHALKGFAAYWHRADVPGRRIDWPGILIFFAVACLWSHFAAGWGVFALPGGGEAPRIDGMLLIAFGPVLGALVAGSIRRGEDHWPVGFRGIDKRGSMAALATPVVLIGLFGVRRFHVEPHVDAAVLAASLLVACAAQEIGWREWLYKALAGLPLWASALATWMLWLLWHIGFVAVVGDEFGQTYDLAYTLGLLVASFVLAAIVRHTRSSGIAAAWRVAALADLVWWQTVVVAFALAAVTWQAAAKTPKA